MQFLTSGEIFSHIADMLMHEYPYQLPDDYSNHEWMRHHGLYRRHGICVFEQFQVFYACQTEMVERDGEHGIEGFSFTPVSSRQPSMVLIRQQDHKKMPERSLFTCSTIYEGQSLQDTYSVQSEYFERMLAVMRSVRFECVRQILVGGTIRRMVA